jgi:hypothetical protein
MRSRIVKVPTRRSTRRLTWVLSAACCFVLALSQALALAVEAPNIRETDNVKPHVFSTRAAQIAAQVEFNGCKETESACRSEWFAEYAPADSKGEPPPPPAKPGESPWTLTGEKTENIHIYIVYLGSADATAAKEYSVLHHLSPKTKYYARFHVHNGGGDAERKVPFETTDTIAPEIAKLGDEPNLTTFKIAELATNAVRFTAQVESNGLESKYSFEYAPTSNGPWFVFDSGTVGVAEDYANPVATLTGLEPETTYFARITAGNSAGTNEQATFGGSGRGSEDVPSFETRSARPQPNEPDVKDIAPEHVLAEAGVVPRHEETRWRFEYARSSAGPWTVGPAGVISQAEAESLPDELTAGPVSAHVQGTLSGLSPDTAYVVRLRAENAAGVSVSNATSFETLKPPSAVASATHALRGEALRLLGEVDPNGNETNYHFEYVSQRDFEAAGSRGGFGQATPLSTLNAGSGDAPVYVGEDLPALAPGETYHYRLVATSDYPGKPLVQGQEQTLTVPLPVSSAALEQVCPNAALRVGLAASLPDCRAFEQVTPVDKENATEIFQWSGFVAPTSGALVGEDGEHLMLVAPLVTWGSTPQAGQSPYFFSRGAVGWTMRAGAPQPESSADYVEPQALAPNLGGVAMEAGAFSGASTVQFKVGSPGGPYAVVATVPKADVGPREGWVASSEDFSTMVLETQDHKLLEKSTGTLSGSDLYAYADGSLSQVNVGIGRCGAQVALGFGERPGEGDVHSTRHTVSADGSRIFFEAVPGSVCSEPTHLFVRVDGRETKDLGQYRLFAANAGGTQLLLERSSGENTGLYFDEPGSAPRYLKNSGGVLGASPSFASEGVDGALGDVYMVSSETAYRYDLATEANTSILHYQHGSSGRHVFWASPDGRYLYFSALGVGGLPAGALVPGGGIEHENIALTEESPSPTEQVFSYDAVERMVECLSCASPSDPEPKLPSVFGGAGVYSGQYIAPDGTPGTRIASSNGDFVFFSSAAALLPEDVDGEIPIEGIGRTLGHEHQSPETSLSSNVYEWRRAGVHGCTRIQGCLSLITDGAGGVENLLIGTTPSGNDVFFYSHSQLVPGDKDTAGDIYDARVNGGFAEPALPTECTGDACFSPASAPSDRTPASETFEGAGNLFTSSLPIGVAKPKPQPKRVMSCKRGSHKRCSKRKHTAVHAKRAARDGRKRRRAGR